MAAIFLLAKVDNEQRLDQKKVLESNLAREFPQKWRDIGNGCYLVATDSSVVTQDVSDKSGISDGGAGGYIVTAINPYYGWASNSTWEWIAANR